jgi:transglutaminase-like putative cysteine protease
MLIDIAHRTEYSYLNPVEFGTHRLLVRPLEGHDVQIRASTLRVSPQHQVRWVHDVFDNSVALVQFKEPSDHLIFESQVVVEQFNTNPFDFIVESYARELPFAYLLDEQPDLQHFCQPCHPRDDFAIREWIRPFLNPQGKAVTLDFLTALNRSIPIYFQYLRREEAGVQTPGETLRLRAGSCRDFALLFMETARCLGLAARFVTGYVCRSAAGPLNAATGATHAWTEIYIPGAGWKGFDPTGGVLAADLHIRSAVARLPAQAAPITGSFIGPQQAFLSMDVSVAVQLTNQPSNEKSP